VAHSIRAVVVVDRRSHLGDAVVVVADNTDDNSGVVVAYNIRVVGILVEVGPRNEVVVVDWDRIHHHHHVDIPPVFLDHHRGEAGEDNSNDVEPALDASVVHQHSLDLFREVHPAYYLDPSPALPLVEEVPPLHFFP
jgi:hypothetical protein